MNFQRDIFTDRLAVLRRTGRFVQNTRIHTEREKERERERHAFDIKPHAHVNYEQRNYIISSSCDICRKLSERCRKYHWERDLGERKELDGPINRERERNKRVCKSTPRNCYTPWWSFQFSNWKYKVQSRSGRGAFRNIHVARRDLRLVSADSVNSKCFVRARGREIREKARRR